MLIRKFSAILCALYIVSILVSCGDGGTLVLPAAETYKINITINAQSASARSLGQNLNENPIIRRDDEISPYLLNFQANDPDVRGLTVFLKTPEGTILGGRTHYTLSESAIRKNQVDGELDDEPEPQKTEFPETPASDTAAGDDNTGDIVADDGSIAAESPPEPAPSETPEPALEIGVLDTRWGIPEQTVTVERLDRELPAFMLNSKLAIGQYLMVFQVIGIRDVLYQQERLFYFLDDANFAFNEIQRYLPGAASIAHLAPPGIAIMFEAQLDFDERLDPYIIWYNSKKRIGEGKVADGLNRFIWTVSDQTGFQTIRAEVFPFEPAQKISGEVKELSLAVSSKSENNGYFSADAERFVYWYQFQNDLLDAVQPKNAKNHLAAEGNVPRWLPVADIYGLAVGPRDRYLLPTSPFLISEEEQGEGELLLRIKPLRDGTFVKAIFKTNPKPNTSESDTIELRCVFIEGKPVLLISAGNVTLEPSILAGDVSAHDLLTVSIKFGLSKNLFTASLYVKELNQGSDPQTITLSTDLNGEAVCQLGSNIPAEDAEDAGAVAIFDEMGVAFSRTSYPPPPQSKNTGVIQENAMQKEITQEASKSTAQETELQALPEVAQIF